MYDHTLLSLSTFTLLHYHYSSTECFLSSFRSFLIGSNSLQKSFSREFCGSLVVRILHFHCCSPGSLPGLGTEIPHQAAACQIKRKKMTSFSSHSLRSSRVRLLPRTGLHWQHRKGVKSDTKDFSHWGCGNSITSSGALAFWLMEKRMKHYISSFLGRNRTSLHNNPSPGDSDLSG